MEIGDRAPDGGVGPRSSTKNVSVPLPPVRKFEPIAIKHVGAAADRNCIVAAAGVNKPVGCRDADVQAVVVVVIYSLVSPLTGPV